jgi:hypothetical protein
MIDQLAAHRDTPRFQAMMASGNFVVTPGGPRRRELVHVMLPGEAVTKQDGLPKKLNLASGELTELVTNETLGAAKPAFHDGWITYAKWTEDPNHIITSMSTTWTVPPKPTNRDDQLIYLFNGLQDSNIQHILQPVLTWGVSADGGGPFWSIASWYVDDSGHAFKSASVNVNEGDVLTGVMTLTAQVDNGFNYDCQFAGIDGTTLRVLGIAQLVMPVITLECYGIKSCADYPATPKTSMRSINVTTAAGPIALNFAYCNDVTDCGQSTTVVSNATGAGAVDLFYRAPTIANR